MSLAAFARFGLLTAAGILVGATSQLPYPATASANPLIALPNCIGKPEVKPRDITLACADGNFRVENIRWTGWGEPFAAGVGDGEVNDCAPDCADGHFHSYLMVVIVSGRQTCVSGQQTYAKLVYSFVGRSPFPSDAPGTEDPTRSLPCHPMP